MDEFDKSFKEKYPLCYAAGVDGNEFKETELNNTLSLDEKVELKLKAGIETTAKEEMRCMLSYDLPGEIWKDVPMSEGKYLLSNKRRIKLTKNGNLAKCGKHHYLYREYSPYMVSPKTLVYLLFKPTEVKPLTDADARYLEVYNSIMYKAQHNIEITPEEIIDSVFVDNLPGEEWKPVPGFESAYDASNMGRLRSHTRDATSGTTIMHFYIRKYVTVHLSLGHCKEKNMDLHRIIAMTWIPKTEEDIRLGRNCVNHKNHIRYDNRVCNLEWCTYSENTIDTLVNGYVGTMFSPDEVSKVIFYLNCGLNPDYIHKHYFPDKSLRMLQHIAVDDAYSYLGNIPELDPTREKWMFRHRNKTIHDVEDILEIKYLLSLNTPIRDIANKFNARNNIIRSIADNVKYIKITKENFPEEYKHMLKERHYE